ncbi:MAG: glycosyltransferase [Candidatus Aminicenantes bacterium]|nr:glycosyltransferase [Candidatus Aminicenantes bacterium]
MKKQLAFIDHSFHKQSNATAFLIDLLKKHYDVKVIWDEAWRGGPPTNLKEPVNQGYDIIVLFQEIRYGKEKITGTIGRNLILAPMYDGCGSLSYMSWKKFKHAKVISFSKNLHNRLREIGIMSKYFQYFPRPRVISSANPGKKELCGFFWQRTDQITWHHIKQLISAADFHKIHIHGAVDPPGYPLIQPSADERKKYRITLSKWFPKQSDYFEILAGSNVFFVPRINEGIGMSFLEAMARGLCVVAPDNPTMNEYIVHGRTGLLYDPQNIKPLDFSNLQEICENARRCIEKGYEEWVKAEADLIAFLEMPFDYKVDYTPPPLKVRFPASVKEIIKEYFPRLTKILIKIKRKLKGLKM